MVRDVRRVVAQRPVDVALVLIGRACVGKPGEGHGRVSAYLDCRAENLRVAEHGRVVIREVKRHLYRRLGDERCRRIASLLDYRAVDKALDLRGRDDRLDPAASLDVDLVPGLADQVVGLVAVHIEHVL